MIDCSADCLVVSHLPPATASVLNKGQSLLFANSSGRGAVSKNIVGRRNSTEDAFDVCGVECYKNKLEQIYALLTVKNHKNMRRV